LSHSVDIGSTILILIYYIITFAIWGPKYNTNVCNPVPRPIDEATPSNIHHPAKYKKSSIWSTTGLWGPSNYLGTKIREESNIKIYQYLIKNFNAFFKKSPILL